MTQRVKFAKFLKLNKKGFSLIELLCAVAIIAIITPVLVNGFVYATKLNYRTRLQQRADAIANDVYEGMASVKFEELEHYLSENNGWKAVEEDVWEAFENDAGKKLKYYVENKEDKYKDYRDDFEVKVAVEEYKETYMVPDLNLIGVQSQYLTLESEINAFDGIVVDKLEMAIKADEEVKKAAEKDIIEKIKDKSDIVLTDDQIDENNILINCGNIDVEKISKEIDITLDVTGSDISPEVVATYEIKYKYSSDNSNSDTTSSLEVSYSYSYEHNGKWEVVSNSSLAIGSAFYIDGVSDKVSIEAEKVGASIVEEQTVFLYYNSLSEMDRINIINRNDSPYSFRVLLIEQGKNYKLKSSNITFSNGVTVCSNNSDVSSNKIPDSIYESTEKEEYMYRVHVYVTYQSKIFAEVSGNFQAGGGTVNQYGDS